MAENTNKKYLSLEGLQEYDTLIKQDYADKITEAVKDHNHDDRYYTTGKVDALVGGLRDALNGHLHDDNYDAKGSADAVKNELQDAIDKIVDGTTPVAKAASADSATNATNATNAVTAEKLGSDTVGATNQPIFISDGVATAIVSTAVAYGGTGATTVEGARSNLGVYSTAKVDDLLNGKSDSDHNHDNRYYTMGKVDALVGGLSNAFDGHHHDDKYDAIGSASAVQGNLDIVSDKVSTLIGSDTDKSVRDIACEELAAQLIAEGAQESLNELKEIAAWIQQHPKDASAMNTAINNLGKLIGEIPEGATATTIVAYAQEIVNAEKARAEGIEAGLQKAIDDHEKAAGETYQTKSEAESMQSDMEQWTAGYVDTNAAAKSHTHAITDVTGLETALADLVEINNIQTQSITDITNDITNNIKTKTVDKIESIDFNAAEPSITINDDDSITWTTGYSLNGIAEGTATFALPIEAGDNMSLAVSEDGQRIVINADFEEIASSDIQALFATSAS